MIICQFVKGDEISWNPYDMTEAMNLVASVFALGLC